MERTTPSMTYQAWRHNPEIGSTVYCSRTVFEDANAELVRDFFWDDEFRPKWDPMLSYFKILEECPQTGATIVLDQEVIENILLAEGYGRLENHIIALQRNAQLAAITTKISFDGGDDALDEACGVEGRRRAMDCQNRSVDWKWVILGGTVPVDFRTGLIGKAL
ncbi:hypothetical protein V2J09_012004 [Rumex salicifolius]